MKTVKPYLMLYVKELKASIIPFLILVMTYIAFILYLLFSGAFFETISDGYLYYYRFIQKFLFMSLLIVPGIFMYSMYDEWITRTSHQMLSLPVPGYIVMLYKYLAVLSMGFIVTISITVYNYIFELKILSFNPGTFDVSNQFIFAWTGFSFVFFLLGMASAIVGILTSIKRYHVLSGILLLSLFFTLSGLFIKLVKIPIDSYLFDLVDGNTWSYVPGQDSFENVYIGLMNGFYSIFLGLIFLIFGLFVFHNYNDI